jgi:hypothetical protein
MADVCGRERFHVHECEQPGRPVDSGHYSFGVHMPPIGKSLTSELVT